MRILHVLSERGFSGGEVQLRYIVEYLQRDHEQHIVLQPGAEFARVAERLGMPITTVRMRNGADLLACWQLRRAVARSGADLVQFACSRSHKLSATSVRAAADSPSGA